MHPKKYPTSHRDTVIYSEIFPLHKHSGTLVEVSTYFTVSSLFTHWVAITAFNRKKKNPIGKEADNEEEKRTQKKK